MTVPKRLRDYLKKNKVDFKTHKHPMAVTTQEVAAAQHVSGHQMVKSVVVKLDGAPALVVVQASQMVNFAKLKKLAGAKKAELANEEEITAWIPDCDPGAMTPMGSLYGMPVYADRNLERQEFIFFNAESHTDTVRIPGEDFKRLARPVLGDLAGK